MDEHEKYNTRIMFHFGGGASHSLVCLIFLLLPTHTFHTPSLVANSPFPFPSPVHFATLIPSLPYRASDVKLEVCRSCVSVSYAYQVQAQPGRHVAFCL